MHFEFLTEDSSSASLLSVIVPKIIGDDHTWRIHPYKGIGRIPKNLEKQTDPSKRILLSQLPRLLKGYDKTPGIDAVIVLVDTDDRNCVEFLGDLLNIAQNSAPDLKVLFRLAIEETEAWYFGDQAAILNSYPKARKDILNSYVQDSVCGTWEKLADAVSQGGSSAIKKTGWPAPGQIKHEWSVKIGERMSLTENTSPSFNKFRSGLLRLIE